MATTAAPASPAVDALRARLEQHAAMALRLAQRLPDTLDDEQRGALDHAVTEADYDLGVAVRAAGLVRP